MKTLTDEAFQQLVDDASVAQRRALVVEAGAAEAFDAAEPDPKLVFPTILCRLCLDPKDRRAADYARFGLAYRGRGHMFGKSALARLFCQFGEPLGPAFQEAVRAEVRTYPGFLGKGTENQVAMERTAGYLFAERFPEDTFFYDLTGAQLAQECSNFMRAYGRTLYSGAMTEYLSPIYHAVNTSAWVNLVEFARDDAVRLMGRAILDWMMADLALNQHLGMILAPYQRAKGMLQNGYQRSYATANSQWTGWLYWGGGNTPLEADAFQQARYAPTTPSGAWAMLHAVSSWVPHRVIRNLGAKLVKTPYAVRQARGNWGCVEPSQLNAYGKPGLSRPAAPDPRYNLRSVYVERDYAVGAGYRCDSILDPITRHAVPFQIVWRSPQPHNWLLVAHPYWYTARRRDDSDQPLGADDWAGVSPFCRMVHWENAAVLLFDIPARDPYLGDPGMGNLKWQSERTADCVQAAHVYVPETVDERVETASGILLREGDVYISIRPLGAGAGWEAGGHPGFRRLALPGVLTGAAVEVGDRREFGSFEAFRDKIAATELDVAERRVVYRSTRGHRLDLRHQGHASPAIAKVNGVRLDFDRWPTCESPYVTCRDRVLEVNDGEQGFTIDWQGRWPAYTYFDLIDGERRITRQERVRNGTLAVT